MIADFAEGTLVTDDARVAYWYAGNGPAVVLLHGYPEDSWCWRHVAPRLAEQYTVVVPDLRGYGASTGPAGGSRGEGYTKREMADDIVAVMAELGHSEFDVVGHDRGGRVGYRLALDHPEVTRSLCVLDIIPTLETFERMTRASALGTYHWYFLAQPAPLPETLIGSHPGYFLKTCMNSWALRDFDEASLDYYTKAFTPAVITASCADYRAGAMLDCDYDAASRQAGDRIAAPVLALWGSSRLRGGQANLEVWRAWARQAVGRQLDCGHFIPEESPEELLQELLPHLAAQQDSRS